MTTPEKPFTPKQCLPKTSHLLGAMIAESTITVARTCLREILPPLPAGSKIHDNGCGTGAVTRAVLEVYPELFNSEEPLDKETRILATDLNPFFVADLPWHLSAFPSPPFPCPRPGNGSGDGSSIQTFVQDTHDLNQIPSGSLTHSFTNFLIFGVKDPVLAAREIHRTLATGGVAVFTTWATLPHSLALDRTRAKLYDEWEFTGEERIPKQHVNDKWLRAPTTVDVLREAGFTGRVQVVKTQTGMVHESLESWTQMGWSWMGMPSGGWTERNENEWDAHRALFGQECLKEGFVVDQTSGKVRVKMEANVILAWK